MSEIIKKGLIFIGGALIGFLAGRKYAKGRYPLELNDEDMDHEELEEYYEQCVRAMKDSCDAESEKPRRTADILKENSDMTKNYREVTSEYASDDEPPVEAVDIHRITFQEFMEPYHGYSKTVLKFYMGDYCLTDEKDEMVSVSDTVGSELLNLFADESVSVVYARNENVGEDFEVVRYDQEYGKEVLGLN